MTRKGSEVRVLYGPPTMTRMYALNMRALHLHRWPGAASLCSNPCASRPTTPSRKLKGVVERLRVVSVELEPLLDFRERHRPGLSMRDLESPRLDSYRL